MRSLWTLEIGIGLVLGLRLVLGVDAIMVLLEGHGKRVIHRYTGGGV